MIIKQFKTGGDKNFGYLAADETSREAAVIDPSYSPEMILNDIHENQFILKYVFITHNHYDHTNGNDEIKRLTGITPLFYGDKEPESGAFIDDNAMFPLGGLEIKIIYTPGHTNDSICLLIEDALFTGDTLFVGKVGGTDFNKQAQIQYHSLHEKILKLPEHTRVFPGHDYGTVPESTIGIEKAANPFLIQPDFASFVELKRNWAEYKIEHGIR